MTNHVAASDPMPGPPSAARISAAVARIGRHFARASLTLPAVFGDRTAATVALQERVTALLRADRFDLDLCAARVRQLAVWLASIAESIEISEPHAATLRVDLAVIVGECDLITRTRAAVAA